MYMLKDQIPHFSHLTLKVGEDDSIVDIVFQSRQCRSTAPYLPLIKADVVGQTLNSLIKNYSAYRSEYEQRRASNVADQEGRESFIKTHEWEALYAALSVYLGIDKDGIDKERCQIDEIQQDDEHLTISFYLLPPEYIACRQSYPQSKNTH